MFLISHSMTNFHVHLSSSLTHSLIHSFTHSLTHSFPPKCRVDLVHAFLYRFLGVVNSLGVAFEAPTLATGFGGYIAQVISYKYFVCVHHYDHCIPITVYYFSL